MIDVSDIITDPDFAQPFTVRRESGGHFGEGGWIAGRITEIPMSGPVVPSSPEELEQVPEGDRVTEARTFYATRPILRTRESGLSDIIRWNGSDYRVVRVWDRSAHGFYKAVAVRMKGD